MFPEGLVQRDGRGVVGTASKKRAAEWRAGSQGLMQEWPRFVVPRAELEQSV